jgi:hypothetical protein
MIATLLVVTVLGLGGLHKAKPHPLVGVGVVVTSPAGRVVALTTERHGRAYLRAVTGINRIKAGSHQSPTVLCRAPLPCEKARSVPVRKKVTRVVLYCRRGAG